MLTSTFAGSPTLSAVFGQTALQPGTVGLHSGLRAHNCSRPEFVSAIRRLPRWARAGRQERGRRPGRGCRVRPSSVGEERVTVSSVRQPPWVSRSVPAGPYDQRGARCDKDHVGPVTVNTADPATPDASLRDLSWKEAG